MYVAGTASLTDVVDDISLLPIQQTHLSQRYRDAESVLLANRQITKVRGHSLGGAVANELKKAFPQLDVAVYAAPAGFAEPLQPGVRAFAHPGDPVAWLSGAEYIAPLRSSGGLLPSHSFEGYPSTRRNDTR